MKVFIAVLFFVCSAIFCLQRYFLFAVLFFVYVLVTNWYLKKNFNLEDCTVSLSPSCLISHRLKKDIIIVTLHVVPVSNWQMIVVSTFLSCNCSGTKKCFCELSCTDPMFSTQQSWLSKFVFSTIHYTFVCFCGQTAWKWFAFPRCSQIFILFILNSFCNVNRFNPIVFGIYAKLLFFPLKKTNKSLFGHHVTMYNSICLSSNC